MIHYRARSDRSAAATSGGATRRLNEANLLRYKLQYHQPTLSTSVKSNSIKIWTAVDCNDAIYCTVLTSYCQRPKLLRPSGNMWVEGVIFGRGQYDVTIVQNK